MNENPYAAPGSEPEDRPVVPLAARKMRTVARTFRLLGWMGMIYFGLGVIGMSINTILSFWTDLGPESVLDTPLFFFVLTLTYCLLFVLFWSIRKLAIHLLAQDPQARKFAIALACLFLPGFPILTGIGIYFLLTIRKYYAEYCALPEPVRF